MVSDQGGLGVDVALLLLITASISSNVISSATNGTCGSFGFGIHAGCWNSRGILLKVVAKTDSFLHMAGTRVLAKNTSALFHSSFFLGRLTLSRA